MEFNTQTGTDILKAASFLRLGMAVPIPTETVYGLS
jgi:tRNA A37 threonylcarbamoyladenosine synthetase subunit TsaC/SUA5/YrdC